MCISDLRHTTEKIQWDLFNYKKAVKERDDLLEENNELNDRLNTLEVENAKLRDNINVLKEDNVRLKRRINELVKG